MNLKKQTINYFQYVISFIIIFWTNILIANKYLPELYGEYQFLTTLTTFLLSVTQMGTAQSYIILASKKLNTQKLITSTYVLRLAGSLLIGISLLLSYTVLHHKLMAFLFVLYLIPLTINMSPVLDFRGKSHIDTRINFLFDAIPFTLFVIAALKINLPIEFIVFARAVTRIVSECIKLNYIQEHFGKLKFSLRYVKWLFKKSRIFILNRVIVEFYSRSELLILVFIATKKEMGIYSAAVAVYFAVLMINGLIDRQLFPKLSLTYGDYNKSKKVLLDSVLIKSIYFVPIVLLLLTFGSDIIFSHIYNKNEFYSAKYILDIMCVGLLTNIFANNTNLLLMAKDQMLYIKRFMIGIILNISLGIGLYKVYSAFGFAFAISIVRVIMVAYSIYMSIIILNKMKTNNEVGKMEKVLIYTDFFERYYFYKRLANSLLNHGYETHFVTNKLSIYLKAKQENQSIFLIKKNRVKQEINADLSNSINVKTNLLDPDKAKLLYLSTLNTLENLNTKYKYSMFFIWNGSWIIEMVLNDFARKENIKTLFFEIGNMPEKIFVDPEGVNAKSMLYRDISILNSYKADNKDYEIWHNNYTESKLKSHFVPQSKNNKKNNNYFYLDYIGYKFFNIPYSYNPSLFNKLKIKLLNKTVKLEYDNLSLKDENYIFFPMQVSSDSQILINSQIDNINAIKELSKIASERKCKLFIKPHPAENNLKFIEQILQLKSKLGFYFINYNTFEIIKYAQEIFTINSTVGLESKIFDKPTSFLGNSFYGKLDSNYLRNYILKYLIDADYFGNKPIPDYSAELILKRVK